MIGFAAARKTYKLSDKRIFILSIVVFVFIFVSGFIGNQGTQETVFAANLLPSQSKNQALGAVRVAVQGKDTACYLTYGPYISLSRGCYKAMTQYSSTASKEQLIGKWDIYDATDGALIAENQLFGTEGEVKQLNTNFENSNYGVHRFEVRNYWNGVSEIHVLGVGVKSGVETPREYFARELLNNIKRLYRKL